MLGAFMAPVGLTLAVLNQTHSGLDLGVVLAAHNLAMLVFLIPAGHFVERYSQVTVLICAHLVSAVIYVITAGALLTSELAITTLVGFATTSGVSSAFIEIARRHLIPALTAESTRQQANSLLRAAENLLAIVGPLVAGGVAFTVGPSWVLALGAPCHLLAAAHLLPIHLGGKCAVTGVPSRYVRGWNEFRSRTWVWTTVLASAVLNGVHGSVWTVLAPFMARQSMTAVGWGTVLGSYAAGVFAMSIVLYYVTARRLLPFGQLCLALTGAVPFVAFAADLDTAYLAMSAFVSGLGFGLFGIAWETSLQAHIPRDAFAHILAYDRAGSLVAVPLGQLTVIPFALEIGTSTAMLTSTIVFSIFGFVPLLSAEFRSLPIGRAEPADVSARTGSSGRRGGSTF